MKKVLICINGKKFGGAEKMTMQLATVFKDLGWRIDLLLNGHENDKIFDSNSRKLYLFQTNYVAKTTIFSSLINGLKLLTILIFNNYDLIIFENKYLLQLGAPIARLFGIKTFYYVHYPPSSYELSHTYLSGLTKVLLCTAGLKKYFQSTKVVEKLIVLNNFVEAPIVHKHILDEAFFNIVTIGHFSEVKNQKFIIEIAKKLETKNLPIKFYLLGTAHRGAEEYFNECQNLIVEDLRLNNVQIVGQVENVTEYLVVANLYLQPSKQEGLPLSVLEAMSQGLPILASKIDGLPDAVEHDVNGFLFDEFNVEEYCSVIERLYADPQQRSEMAKASIQKYQNMFTRDVFERKVNQILISTFT